MNKKSPARVAIFALIGISIVFLGYFVSLANAGGPCEPHVNIQGVTTVGEIAQGKNVSLQVSVLNEKTSPVTGYELKMPAGINALTFTPSSIPFNITASTLQTFNFNITVNTNEGDYELVFLLDKSGYVCSYAIYHFIVARDHFTPGIYNITVYNEIILNITVNNNNTINNNVFLNLSRFDHVLKIMTAGILVSIGIWGMFNAQPIWIVEDRERRLHHHFKRGLGLVSAAVAEILFSSYLFAVILPPVLTGVLYGNEIYGLLCAGTALFGALGIDRMKYRVTACAFLITTLLMSSLEIALIATLFIVTSSCIYLLQRLARGYNRAQQEQPMQGYPRIIKRLKKADKKMVYEL